MNSLIFVPYLLLLLFILIFVILEIILFKKAPLNFSRSELIKRIKDTKRKLIIFSLLTLSVPFVNLPISFIFVRPIPLIGFIITFFTVSFALALSTQQLMFFGLKKNLKKTLSIDKQEDQLPSQ